jgi:hypothetical protein
MPEKDVLVRTINQHYDKLIGGTRYENEEPYLLPEGSARRRVRRNLVEIIDDNPDAESNQKEARPELEDKMVRPEIEDKAESTAEDVEEDDAPQDTSDEAEDAESTAEDVEVAFDPDQYIERRGESSWYDVEGSDESPIQGYDNAVEEAKNVHM